MIDAQPGRSARQELSMLTPAAPAVLARLRRQRVKDTAPEMALRKRLHAMGLRYRVDFRPLAELRSRADIAFTRARVAVYVDGCYWHRCPEHGTAPKNNSEWWRLKLDRNVARDRETDAALAAAGWTVVRVWEHESACAAAGRVEKVVRARQ